MGNSVLADIFSELRSRDFYRYCAAQLAPIEHRAFASVFFLLERELLDISAKVKEPGIGLIRVAWWRDQILALKNAAPPAQPLLVACHKFQQDLDALADYADCFDMLFDAESDKRVQRDHALYRLLGARLVLAGDAGKQVTDAYGAANIAFFEGANLPKAEKKRAAMLHYLLRCEIEQPSHLRAAWWALRS